MNDDDLITEHLIIHYKRGKEEGYSKALNDLRSEVFKNIDWGDNHGNMGLMSKRQINKMINSLNAQEATK